jgi:hypothetical protein
MDPITLSKISSAQKSLEERIAALESSVVTKDDLANITRTKKMHFFSKDYSNHLANDELVLSVQNGAGMLESFAIDVNNGNTNVNDDDQMSFIVKVYMDDNLSILASCSYAGGSLGGIHFYRPANAAYDKYRIYDPMGHNDVDNSISYTTAKDAYEERDGRPYTVQIGRGYKMLALYDDECAFKNSLKITMSISATNGKKKYLTNYIRATYSLEA